MNERAFPTEADRRALIAIRASALRRLVEPIAMRNQEQKIRLDRELIHLAMSSDTLPLPRTRRQQSELCTQVLEHDPMLEGEPRARILDLLEILEAPRWPLAWYAVESRALDEVDHARIAALIDAFAAAAAARDEAAAMALYGIEGEYLEFTRSWFRSRVIDVAARVERCDGYAVQPRFDGRRALVGSKGPVLRLVSTTRDGASKTVDVSLSAVRARGGWQLG
ncbi:MAG: hypothetical protein JNM61_09480 [Zoogloeaceae bacterium]|nr:hypothetical protein [Zoogloeaceae bacterium]